MLSSGGDAEIILIPTIKYTLAEEEEEEEPVHSEDNYDYLASSRVNKDSPNSSNNTKDQHNKSNTSQSGKIITKNPALLTSRTIDNMIQTIKFGNSLHS